MLINCLVQQHRGYDAETNGQMDALALRLCDIAEAMKPGRKKKIPFEPVEIKIIRQCLMECEIERYKLKGTVLWVPYTNC